MDYQSEIKFLLDSYTYSEKEELEFRLGNFSHPRRFNSEIGGYIYHNIMSTMAQNKGFTKKTHIQTIKQYKNKIKEIISSTGEVTVIKKKNKGHVDLLDHGLRISLNSETILDGVPLQNMHDKVHTKQRVRNVFTANSGSYKIDLTKDTVLIKSKYGKRDRHKDIFQYEVEYLIKPTFEQVMEMAAYLSGLNKNLQYNQYIVELYNKNFNLTYQNRTIAYDGGAMPKNIKPFNIPYLTNYWTLVKPDGVSFFMFFSQHGVFMINKTTVYQVSQQPIQSLVNTVILGEWMEKTGTYLAFDTLIYHNEDVRQHFFDKRYTYIQDLARSLQKEQLSFKYEVLKCFTSDNVNENISGVFAHMNKEYRPDEVDGIIFKSPHEPFTSKFLYKWKPPQHNTIDFKTKLIGPDKYSLYSYGPGPTVPPVLFTGTEEFPLDGSTVIPPQTVSEITGGETIIPDDSIVEFKYESMKFIPTRVRYDKVKPNFIGVAKGTWEDIKKPLSKEELLQLTVHTLDPAEPVQYNAMVVCNFLNITNDIRVFHELSSYLGSPEVYQHFKEAAAYIKEKAVPTSKQKTVNELNVYFKNDK